MTGVRITQRDITIFTEGDCHTLAMAIHRHTGWPVHAFIRDNGEADVHAFVKMPDGMYLDVLGVKSEKQMWESWGFWLHSYVRWEIGEVEDFREFEDNGWGYDFETNVQYRAMLRRADAIAKHLAGKYGSNQC